MKIKNIQLSVKERKPALNEFAEALAKARRGEREIPHEEVSFQNIDTLRRILTDKRMELLHVIRQHHPRSVYELAKIVNRDLKNVNEELQILVELGIVSLEHVDEGRERVVPRVEFDKMKVEIAI